MCTFIFAHFRMHIFFCSLQKLDPNMMIDGRRPLHYAADYGQKEIIEYLIKLGSDVNVSY